MLLGRGGKEERWTTVGKERRLANEERILDLVGLGENTADGPASLLGLVHVGPIHGPSCFSSFSFLLFGPFFIFLSKYYCLRKSNKIEIKFKNNFD